MGQELSRVASIFYLLLLMLMRPFRPPRATSAARDTRHPYALVAVPGTTEKLKPGPATQP